MWITIRNPINANGPPLFQGPITRAPTDLEDGTYIVVDHLDGQDFLVKVEGSQIMSSDYIENPVTVA